MRDVGRRGGALYAVGLRLGLKRLTRVHASRKPDLLRKWDQVGLNKERVGSYTEYPTLEETIMRGVGTTAMGYAICHTHQYVDIVAPSAFCATLCHAQLEHCMNHQLFPA